jgi:hypothetical protein
MRWRSKKEKYEAWHDWFAWHPVKVVDDWPHYAWLETVSRRGLFICAMVAPLMYKDIWIWEYKTK